MEELLADCGLGRIEQKVLIYLLKSGTARAAIIAKRIGEKRPSVYTALQRLTERGLIVVNLKNQVNSYSALKKDLLIDSLRKNIQADYLRVNDSIDLLSPRLDELVETNQQTLAGYEIGSTSSLNGTLVMLEEALTSDYDSIADLNVIYAIPEISDLAYRLAKNKRLNKLKIREALVKNKSAVEWSRALKTSKNYQVRTFTGPKLINDMIVTKNKVYMFNYDSEEPLCLYIEHKNYVNFMQFMFNSFWNSL